MKKLLLFLLLAGCTTVPPVQELPESDYCRLSTIPTKLLIEGAEVMISEPYLGKEGFDSEETLMFLGTRALVMCSLGCLGSEKKKKCDERFNQK